MGQVNPIEQIQKEKAEIPEVLTGQETADMIEDLCKHCSPEFSRHLVESNVVLTLAGLKPQTEFFIDINKNEDAEPIKSDVEALNIYLKKKNFPAEFMFIEPYEKGGQIILMVGVFNFVGLERISKKSKFPGLEAYDPKTGLSGMRDWFAKTESTLIEAQQTGQIPANVDIDSIVLAGLFRGYPDQAILDFGDAIAKEDQGGLVGSQIPYAGTYREAVPNFDFYPEHAEDPEIVGNIRQAGQILEQFYNSDWHKKVK